MVTRAGTGTGSRSKLKLIDWTENASPIVLRSEYTASVSGYIDGHGHGMPSPEKRHGSTLFNASGGSGCASARYRDCVHTYIYLLGISS